MGYDFYQVSVVVQGCQDDSTEAELLLQMPVMTTDDEGYASDFMDELWNIGQDVVAGIAEEEDEDEQDSESE